MAQLQNMLNLGRFKHESESERLTNFLQQPDQRRFLSYGDPRCTFFLRCIRRSLERQLQ